MSQIPDLQNSLFAKDISDLIDHIHHIQEHYSEEYQPHWKGFKADYKAFSDPYADILNKQNISEEERFILVASLLPNCDFNILYKLNTSAGVKLSGGFIEHSGLIPNGETICFLMGEERRREITSALSIYGNLMNAGLIAHHVITPEAPFMSKLILPSEELQAVTLFNRTYHPSYSTNFPAEQLTTTLEWEDMVLTYQTKQQLRAVENWLSYENQLAELSSVSRKMKKGYRALFHGPSGTGKTATAALLGKQFGRDVYRVDLSMMVSKYIGETEKNLKKIFDVAEHRDWILFFDEADSIFGKRTKASSSNDRYANQEVSYLLQRIENYEGVILLATNFRANMDDAFKRRFQAMVSFPSPKQPERLELWRKILDTEVPISDEVDFRELSNVDNMTGAMITNVLQFCVLEMFRLEESMITLKMISDGIMFEKSKI
ncbi:ATP-binding protein [Reichenbachiella versicolor]|uniref:ATP-binding protein n=1 Tax=Reichenbachiella versicolor TaxID=1821036 RepID=UPI000D6E29FD|nr:ATP-binding protein [Reichenbachiella versicolor]